MPHLKNSDRNLQMFSKVSLHINTDINSNVFLVIRCIVVLNFYKLKIYLLYKFLVTCDIKTVTNGLW